MLDTLVLDAGAFILKAPAQIQQFAEHFYTTPGVYRELKDERVRSQLVLWENKLEIRQPKVESINEVSRFAKITGDYAVLSTNDVHLIALCYELECELNGGDGRLRKYPGAKRNSEVAAEKEKKQKEEKEVEEKKPAGNDGWTTVKKNNPRERKGRSKKSAAKKVEMKIEEKTEEKIAKKEESTTNSQTETLDEDGWITPDNLQETILKDNGEAVETDKTEDPAIKVALSTGDFAIQNVSLQIGLELVNITSGLRIKKVRNYMYRCHACFSLTALPKDGTPKHFCPNCGGATLMRCAVGINSKTGKITPYLKKNFEWHNKGNVHSMPSPLSKRTSKKYGKGGYQHTRDAGDEFLREDQKEYQHAVKQAQWQRRKNEKMLEDFVGGGSAENIVSPFTGFSGNTNVKVGKGRYANAPKRRTR